MPNFYNKAPMVHIDEFLQTANLRAEQKAGFRAYAGKAYADELCWNKMMEEYKNRKIKEGR